MDYMKQQKPKSKMVLETHPQQTFEPLSLSGNN